MPRPPSSVTRCAQATVARRHRHDAAVPSCDLTTSWGVGSCRTPSTPGARPCSGTSRSCPGPSFSATSQLGSVDVISLCGCLDDDGKLVALACARKVTPVTAPIRGRHDVRTSARTGLHVGGDRCRAVGARSRACSSSRCSSTGSPASTGRSTSTPAASGRCRWTSHSATTCRGSGTTTVTGIRLPVAAPRAHPPQFWHDAVASYVGFAVRFVRGPERRHIVEHAVGRAKASKVGADVRVARPAARHPLRSRPPSSPAGAHPPVPRRRRARTRRLRQRQRSSGGRRGPRSSGDDLSGRALAGCSRSTSARSSLRRQPRRTDLPPGTWGLSVGANGTLWSGAVDLLAVARCPRHAGARRPRRPARRSSDSALAPHRAGAAADIFYSYKTNPVPAVLHRLHDQGIGAEVISPYELWLAIAPRACRASASSTTGRRSRPTRSAQAIRHDVCLVNANSAEEAALIARLAAERAVAPSTSGSASPLPGMWGGQFGIAADSSRVAAAVRDARWTHSWSRSRAARPSWVDDPRRGDDAVVRRRRARLLRRPAGPTGWHPADRSTSAGAWPARPWHRSRRGSSGSTARSATDLLPPDPAATA